MEAHTHQSSPCPSLPSPKSTDSCHQAPDSGCGISSLASPGFQLGLKYFQTELARETLTHSPPCPLLLVAPLQPSLSSSKSSRGWDEPDDSSTGGQGARSHRSPTEVRKRRRRPSPAQLWTTSSSFQITCSFGASLLQKAEKEKSCVQGTQAGGAAWIHPRIDPRIYSRQCPSSPTNCPLLPRTALRAAEASADSGGQKLSREAESGALHLLERLPADAASSPAHRAGAFERGWHGDC